MTVSNLSRIEAGCQRLHFAYCCSDFLAKGGQNYIDLGYISALPILKSCYKTLIRTRRFSPDGTEWLSDSLRRAHCIFLRRIPLCLFVPMRHPDRRNNCERNKSFRCPGCHRRWDGSLFA